ncbi:MAG: putative NADH-flavin reductase [Firmicutes bacterium]|nr:putative NADH-flavin reductase [Bacillota bacterium]
MKLAIFGASGGIGEFIVKHALDKSYTVNAYVRSPAKFNILHEQLTIIKGELNDYKNIKSTIKGCDAVISSLGCPMKWTYEGTAVLDGHKNIVRAMEELGLSRFIGLATPSVKFAKDKSSFATIVPGIIAGIVFPKAKKEIIAVANTITNSTLNWTIVRILAPKDTPYTGNVKTSFGDIKIDFNISREDIAVFMLDQVENNEFSHSMPIIGS